VFTTTKRLTKRELVKQQQDNFIVAWSSSLVRETRNRFHYNFKASIQAHPLGYRGVNLGSITSVEISLAVNQKGSCNILATTTNT